MTLHLFIEPLDVWLFRDGKPFNAGSDHRARSVFPPSPMVMQGVIRSHYIELNGGIPAYLASDLPEVQAKIGKKGEPPPETFRLRGPFLVSFQNEELTCYFPLPAHAYLDGDYYRLLKPEVKNGIITDLGSDQPLLWRKEGSTPTKSEGRGWLSQANLQALLKSRELPKSAVKPGSYFFERESRLGIELNAASRSTATGKLYEAEFIRPCPSVGLYLAVEGLELPEHGVMMIGGEGRAGSYRQVKAPPHLPDISVVSTNENGFTLTFLTPAYFAKGWQPDSWASFWGDSIEFVAAAVGRPLILGGFDLAHKKHKVSRRYVPAGSTYFFKGIPTSTPTAICDKFTEFNQQVDPGQIGFGQFILGGW